MSLVLCSISRALMPLIRNPVSTSSEVLAPHPLHRCQDEWLLRNLTFSFEAYVCSSPAMLIMSTSDEGRPPRALFDIANRENGRAE